MAILLKRLGLVGGGRIGFGALQRKYSLVDVGRGHDVAKFILGDRSPIFANNVRKPPLGKAKGQPLLPDAC